MSVPTIPHDDGHVEPDASVTTLRDGLDASRPAHRPLQRSGSGEGGG